MMTKILSLAFPQTQMHFSFYVIHLGEMVGHSQIQRADGGDDFGPRQE